MHLLRVRDNPKAQLGFKNEKKGYFQEFHFSSAKLKSYDWCIYIEISVIKNFLFGCFEAEIGPNYEEK